MAGIPIAGAARLGDEVVLLPHDITSRVKRIEVYGQNSDTVLAGQCAAVNLGHCDAHEIKRGDVLTLPGYFAPQEFFLCRLRLLPYEKLVLRNGAQVKFHTGASEVNAACYLLEAGEVRGGCECFVQLRTKRPIVAGPGDPFLIRTFGPVQTVGGGIILEATDRRLKRKRPGALEDLHQRAAAVGDDARFVDYALRTAAGLAVAEADLARRTKILRGRLKEILDRMIAAGDVLALGTGVYLHRAAAAEAGKTLLAQLAQFHRDSPESPGMTFDQLRQACPWPKGVLEAVVGCLKEAGRVTEKNQRFALPEHRPTVRDQDARGLEAVESLFPAEPLSSARRRRVGRAACPVAGHRRAAVADLAGAAAVGGGGRGAASFTRRRSTRPGGGWSSICRRKGVWRAWTSSIFWTRRGSSPCRSWITSTARVSCVARATRGF